jgi:hypothetical protein
MKRSDDRSNILQITRSVICDIRDRLIVRSKIFKLLAPCYLQAKDPKKCFY